MWLKDFENDDIIDTSDLIEAFQYLKKDYSLAESYFEFEATDELCNLLKKVDDIYYK